MERIRKRVVYESRSSDLINYANQLTNRTYRVAQRVNKQQRGPISNLSIANMYIGDTLLSIIGSIDGAISVSLWKEITAR